MSAGSGYDLSQSTSNSASAATGATKFGSTGNSGIITGGSVGLSTNIVLMIVGALVAVWFFFMRKN